MQIRYRANGVEVLAPAKVNLFFEVLNRRNDGFHEIETLMAPVSLFDSLVLEDDPSGKVSLQATWSAGLAKHRPAHAMRPAVGSDLENLPEGDGNIVVRAVRLLAQLAGIDRGAKMRLVKRIPSAAGLGGGSSDAAATLVAANLVWNLGWERQRLAEVGAQLGSDVPFFLADGPAMCRGRGEKIEPVSGLEGLDLVIVRPPVGLSTAAVYGICQPGRSAKTASAWVDSLQKRNWPKFGSVAYNSLLPAAKKLSTEVGAVLDRLAGLSCPLVGMSGSGSSCFAVVRNKKQAFRLARQLRAEAMGRTWPVRSIRG